MKKADKSSTSAVDCFDDDLVEFCILPRLPVVSLMRFKCVSKKWHRMISFPNLHFIYKQLHYASSGILLHSPSMPLCYYISKDPGNLDIQKSNDHIYQMGTQIKASCNGFICIAIPIFKKLYIGNPFMKDWKQLPLVQDCQICFWGMAVDVRESSLQYKIVVSKELWNNGHREHEFHVFSSTSEQWEVVEKRIQLVALCSDIGVYVMGTLYWRFRRYNDYAVLRFSLEDGEGSLQPLPRGANDGRIGECDGKLCYTMFREGEIEMWSLDQSQWSKRLSINFVNCNEKKLKNLVPPSNKMQLRRKKLYSAVYPVSLLPFEGGDVFAFSVDGALYFYDIRNGEIREQLFYWDRLAVFPYRNTILPLSGKISEVGVESRAVKEV